MEPNVRFTCTALSRSAKKGILTRDDDGYYTTPIGALNTFNSAGEYYPYEGAKELFTSSGAFMRRIQTGCLKSEEGHPKPLPGQSMESFIERVFRIDEKNVCAHIAEIYLDFNSLKDAAGRPIVAIMGKVKPAGPHAAALEASFNNAKEDVCFSIRAFTDDKKVAGINQRTLIEVVTFDRVTEPGINTSRKFMAPALESRNEVLFTREALVNSSKSKPTNLSMESGGLSPYELFKKLGWETSALKEPSYMKW